MFSSSTTDLKLVHFRFVGSPTFTQDKYKTITFTMSFISIRLVVVCGMGTSVGGSSDPPVTVSQYSVTGGGGGGGGSLSPRID